MIPPCLTLSNIRYVSRVKWSNPRKRVAPSPTFWCSSYWKGNLLVAFDYSHQLYFVYLLVWIILYNKPDIFTIFFLMGRTYFPSIFHHLTKEMSAEIYKKKWYSKVILLPSLEVYGVMIIILGNGYGSSSSNSGQSYQHFTSH